MPDTNLLPWYIPVTLYGIALIYTVLTCLSIRAYIKNHTQIKELADRCEECEAEVLNTIVFNGAETSLKLRQASQILAGFQNIANLPVEYVCTEVRFNIGHDVETAILRRASMKIIRPGDTIRIYYDPFYPEQAFSKDMKKIILHKPFRDCVIHGLVAVISLASAIFMQLAG